MLLTIFIALLTGVVGLLIGKFIYASKNDKGEMILLKSNLEISQQENLLLKKNLEISQQKNIELEKSSAIAQTENSHLQQRLTEQKQELTDIQEKFTKEFQNIATKILDENSQKFSQQNKTSLDIIVNPLKEKIAEFEKKVQAVYDTESDQRNTLKGEIKQLILLNQQMSIETQNLTNALKGDTKSQGTWGEQILEKILEKSGLVKDREYRTQVSLNTEDGKRFQPDVIVDLPDNKCLIIDSKVSLIAYEKLANASNEQEYENALNEHLVSIRTHIKGLSEKNYHQLYAVKTLDFVLLFMPIEPAFALALQKDNELFDLAFKKNIIIVSPTTLMATLRTIANIWRTEYQNKNAIEIAKKAGDMYDKFVNFVEDLLVVGDKMNQAQTSYKEAMNKVSTGTGNLIRRVEQLKDLGVKANKAIPQKLLDRAEE